MKLCLCLLAANGVVLATEKKHRSILYEEHSVHKIEMITPKIGMVYSGMGPDYRLLVRQARKMAQQYWVTYQEQIPTAQHISVLPHSCKNTHNLGNQI